MTYGTVLSNLTGNGVRCITLNRPDSLNVMNLALINDLARAFEDANADPDTRAIILTGAGKAFCAGDDRRAHVYPDSEQEARALVDAINCDFPIWAESARGFCPEVSLNLFMTGAVTTLLPAMVGLHKAREMLFFGDRYDAATLADMGVAWRVVPDDRLMAEAQEVAAKLAALPSLSVRAMKRGLNLAAVPDIHRALQLETDATVAGFMDPETTRRLSAF